MRAWGAGLEASGWGWGLGAGLGDGSKGLGDCGRARPPARPLGKLRVLLGSRRPGALRWDRFGMPCGGRARAPGSGQPRPTPPRRPSTPRGPSADNLAKTPAPPGNPHRARPSACHPPPKELCRRRDRVAAGPGGLPDHRPRRRRRRLGGRQPRRFGPRVAPRRRPPPRAARGVRAHLAGRRHVAVLCVQPDRPRGGGGGGPRLPAARQDRGRAAAPVSARARGAGRAGVPWGRAAGAGHAGRAAGAGRARRGSKGPSVGPCCPLIPYPPDPTNGAGPSNV